jgi:hypothetical protein
MEDVKGRIDDIEEHLKEFFSLPEWEQRRFAEHLDKRVQPSSSFPLKPPTATDLHIDTNVNINPVEEPDKEEIIELDTVELKNIEQDNLVIEHGIQMKKVTKSGRGFLDLVKTSDDAELDSDLHKKF